MAGAWARVSVYRYDVSVYWYEVSVYRYDAGLATSRRRAREGSAEGEPCEGPTGAQPAAEVGVRRERESTSTVKGAVCWGAVGGGVWNAGCGRGWG
jgi:hypothetical protein